MSGKITNLRQIEQISLREQVAGALRAAIVSGELEPGDVYSAPALGAKFGVSATPVREAMLDLVRENLVTTVPNKGYRVTTMDEADLDDITELRMLVEPPLTAQITPDVPAGDMPALRELAQAIVDGALAGDLVAYTEADRAFHLKLLEYAATDASSPWFRTCVRTPACMAWPPCWSGGSSRARPASTTRSSTPSRRASLPKQRS